MNGDTARLETCATPGVPAFLEVMVFLYVTDRADAGIFAKQNFEDRQACGQSQGSTSALQRLEPVGDHSEARGGSLFRYIGNEEALPVGADVIVAQSKARGAHRNACWEQRPDSPLACLSLIAAARFASKTPPPAFPPVT